MTVINQTQTLQDAPASSSVTNPRAGWEPRVTWHRKTFRSFSGATSKRICGVSSELVRIRVSEFTVFWPGYSLASLRRCVETSFCWGVTGYQPMDIKWQTYPHSGTSVTLSTATPLTHSSKNTKSVIKVSTSLFLLHHRSLCWLRGQSQGDYWVRMPDPENLLRVHVGHR